MTDEQIKRVTEIVDAVKLDEHTQDTDVYVDAILAAVQEVDPEQLTIALREWGAQHNFSNSEAEDSFDRGIGNIFWALAVESAATRGGEENAES